MEEIRCAVLVIGSGAAGARAAYEAKKEDPSADILLIAQGTPETDGSTGLIASEALGINAPLNLENDGDTPDIYYEDILRTGGGLCDNALCRILADEAADRVLELINLGVVFEGREGRLAQKKLSGCTKARSLTCGGSTGRMIVRALLTAAAREGVRVMGGVTVTRFLRNNCGEICGVAGSQMHNQVIIAAKAVILATGGAGSMFKINVTPPTQTGDGWAMAYKVGCRFANMEFFQVGPAVAGLEKKFIIHSHMWRFLPRLANRFGQEFLMDYCPVEVLPEKALELKAMSYPFSVRTEAMYVDIAIFKEIAADRGNNGGGVWFDVTHVPKDELLRRAPITYRTLLSSGIDIAQIPMSLTLAVQNFNGGIVIDEDGFTGVIGLYAAGEATGGVHGSDRPGGNNLTDTQVFGRRAGIAAARFAADRTLTITESMDSKSRLSERDIALIQRSEQVFYDNMTIVRSESGLRKTLAFIEEVEGEVISDSLRNRLTVGKLFATAQLMRVESRGTHYREDYPFTNPGFDKRIILFRKDDGSLTAE